MTQLEPVYIFNRRKYDGILPNGGPKSFFRRNLHPRVVESDIFSLRFCHRSAHWRDSVLDTMRDRILGSDGVPNALWARCYWPERDWLPVVDRHIHGAIWCFDWSSCRSVITLRPNCRPLQPLHRHRPFPVLRCHHPVPEYVQLLARLAL